MDSEKLPINRPAFFIRQWLQSKAALIDHNAVIKEVYREIDISAGYFLMLTIANLIALIGLITNNAAVIIGAMLLSPLMGPILSSGFAFITGERRIGKNVLKKIMLSIVITLIVAAIATYLSPLREVTEQVIIRTRPNLYDLIIAFLAGTAGAVALCTKKHYITVVTGVAIATAVIPPLSVAGFGIGIGSFYIALGGLFLFFTNFVAIIFATCIVFYIYGFRPGITLEGEVKELEIKFSIILTILLIISLPLIYTMKVSVTEARLRNNIHAALKKELDREGYSHLTSFTFSKEKDDRLKINVSINVVSYLKEFEIKNIEDGLKETLQQDVLLNVEQVQAKAGGLKEGPVKPAIAPGIIPHKPPEEVAKSSVEAAVGTLKKISEKIERIISPSKVAGIHIGFLDKSRDISVILRLRRDIPLSEEQRRWLQKILSEALNLPVNLTIETAPFIEPLIFGTGEVSLSEEMKKTLMDIKEAYIKDAGLTIVIESFPGSQEGKRQRNLAGKRAKVVKTIFLEDYKMPKKQLKVIIHKKTTAMPMLKLSLQAQR